MKSGSRPTLRIIGLALWIVCGVSMTAQAQDREKYIISATAGGINYVSGNVTVERRGSHRPQGLTAKDNLQTGDSVTTGAGGRVEVLLNPGSYMRVDENSEFELADASLDNLRVQLIKGSAILEVTGADDVRTEIAINTPQTDVLIIKSGIYRFNILPNETTELSVRKGRALVDKRLSNEVKGGQKVLIGRNRFEVAKLDKKNQDTLDLWSKERAGSLAHANRSLQTRALVAAFAAFDERDFGRASLKSYYYGLGLWVYNPRLGDFCFIPLGARYWSSPYGYDYPTAYGYTGSGWNGAGGTQGNGGSGNGTTGSTGGNGGSNNGGNTNPTPAPQPISQPPSIERSQPPASASHIERAGGEVPNRNPDQ